jgi:hypothetical protein
LQFLTHGPHLRQGFKKTDGNSAIFPNRSSGDEGPRPADFGKKRDDPEAAAAKASATSATARRAAVPPELMRLFSITPFSLMDDTLPAEISPGRR